MLHSKRLKKKQRGTPVKSIHVIANPVAGGGRGADMARALIDALEAHGYSVTFFATARAGDARREAGAVRSDVIAVVGGDGTLNEVLNGLPERSTVQLAILPVGTANVVARELGMTPDPALAARAIADGKSRPMDLGLHDGRRFLLGAGAGVDAAVTKAVQERRGSKSSLLHWVWPAFRVLMTYTYPKIDVWIDGEELVAGADYVIVGNCLNSAGIFPATPRAETADGLLDVCAISGLSRARIGWLLLNVWRPAFLDQPWIAYRQGKCIELRPHHPDAPVLLQIDGDPAGTLPARLEIAGWRIQMIVPAAIGAPG